MNELAKFQEIADDLIIGLTAEIPETIATLEGQYPSENIPEDMSETTNYNLVKDAIREIKAPRIELEKNRKEVKAVPFALCKKIDDAARPHNAKLIALEEPWKNAKKDYDLELKLRKEAEAKAEEDRIEEINKKIVNLRCLAGINYHDSESISSAIEDVEGASDDCAWAMEFAESAKQSKKEAAVALKSLLERTIAFEEIEAKKEAEKQAEIERIEAQRIANEEASRNIAEQQAEIDRQKEELAGLEEAKKAEAEQETLKNFEENKGETIIAMSAYDDEDSLVDAIISGDIPHVKWVG